MKKAPFWFLAIFAVFSSNRAGASLDCELKIVVKNTTDTKISLSWTYSCRDGLQEKEEDLLYKVYYEHMEWKACLTGVQDETRKAGRGDEETDDREIVLKGLHPYSIYRITVKALPLSRRPFEAFIVAETRSGIPDVRPQTSKIPVRASETSLKFSWRNPLPSECRNFNGKLDGVYYALKGLNPWNLDLELTGTSQLNSLLFEHLKPFSDYTLFLYTRTEELGRHNRNLQALKLKGKTQASTPKPPESFAVLSKAEDVVHLTWSPGYPPTGVPDRFVIRWRESSNPHWLDSIAVPADIATNLCQRRSDFRHYGRAEMCYSIKELDSDANLTFTIASYNEGITERSEWADEVAILSEMNNRFTGSPGNEDHDEDSNDELSLVHMIIIAVVCIIGMLLILVLFTYKCRKKKIPSSKYRNVPGYERQRFVNRYEDKPSNVATPPQSPPSTTMKGSPMRPSRSIQELPLPPVPGDHFYEELPLVSAKKSNNECSSLEEEENEDMYLKPRMKENKSSESLDVEEYLKPTFNQFETIDAQVLSDPPKEPPPPIPMGSYISNPNSPSP